MPNQQRYLLEKLGEAYYKHKKLRERAEKGKQAVNYLFQKGVLK